MKAWRNFVIWLYSHLLRLYPARFRAEYAEEMAEVFRLKLDAADMRFALVVMLFIELRDMPLSVIREYLRERRYHMPNVMIGGQPQAIYRTCVIGSAMMIALYGLIVVRPVMALSLNHEAVEKVNRGDLNVYHYVAEGFFSYRALAPEDEGTLRGFMQLDTLHGLVMVLAGMVILLGVPVGIVIFSSVLAVNLSIHWQRMRRQKRIFGSLMLTANALLILFIISPGGYLVMSWWGVRL